MTRGLSKLPVLLEALINCWFSNITYCFACVSRRKDLCKFYKQSFGWNHSGFDGCFSIPELVSSSSSRISSSLSTTTSVPLPSTSSPPSSASICETISSLFFAPILF
ncbi:hypothetical protein BDA99DRAFT_526495 [Phascolomyces articulosus]|uniref:Uncharacterized protein n=1 Tax=Phascolomyces articulosus TaxID=60185 RepID=A0AAD5JZI3_9FUNG|nr:hypothetical protein BDA99DRAFT_526495 [Phascolomyces articulosus]